MRAALAFLIFIVICTTYFFVRLQYEATVWKLEKENTELKLIIENGIALRTNHLPGM